MFGVLRMDRKSLVYEIKAIAFYISINTSSLLNFPNQNVLPLQYLAML